MMTLHPLRGKTTAFSRGEVTLLASTIVAALGSFLCGFDTSVISGTTASLREVFGLTDNLLGFTVSSALIGTMVGTLVVGRPSDWWGRRPVLALLAVLFLLSAAGCSFARNWYAFLFFRWLGGVAVGGGVVVSPLYITEIAPAKRRGRLVAVAQLNMVIGILAAYLSNCVIATLLGDAHTEAWRWMFGVMVVPSGLFLGLVLLIPESPRWLVARGRSAEAEEVLTRVGRTNPQQETVEIAESLRAEQSATHQRLFHRRYRKPLLLALMIAAFSQLDGISAVIYYSAEIFRLAGADKTSALMQSVIIGASNLVMTFVGMALIDRLGRKPLLLIGSVTFVVSHLMAAWAFHAHAQGWVALAAMIGIVGSHAYSVGAVIWVCINELLPNAVRASGSAVVCCAMCTLAAGVTWSFPVVARVSSAGTFGFFAAMMLLQFVLVWRFLPETKGISLEELQKHLETL